MERIGIQHAGEIRSHGVIEGVEEVQDDAPFRGLCGHEGR